MRKLTQNIPPPKSKNEFIAITSKGCDACDEYVENGMCDRATCIDIFSDQGKDLDQKVDIDSFPTILVKTKSGRIRKANAKEEKKVLQY